MPFKSEAQRRFLWAKHPKMAKRWAHEYPGQKNLPKHVKKKTHTKHSAHQGNDTMTLEEQIIDTFQANAAALGQAEAILAEKTASVNRVNQLIPAAVDACVANGRIDADEKQAMAAALADHSQTIELLINLAGHRNNKEAAATSLGTPVGKNGLPVAVKKASAYTGARSSAPSEADYRFEQAILGR
jgi:hypothetical protein